MAIRTYDILLDSYNSTIPEPIVGRQGDKNGAVTLHVTITDRGSAVDLTGQTINLMAETAKGTAIVADNDGVTVTNAANGKFDYAIPNALWSESGKIKRAYFSLNDADGQQTTYNLIFIVKKAVDISQGKADDYITIIDGTLRSLQQKIDAMNTDLKTIIDAYNSNDFYSRNDIDAKPFMQYKDTEGTLTTAAINDGTTIHPRTEWLGLTDMPAKTDFGVGGEIKYVAHRGNHAAFPENSLPAFRTVTRHWGIETDTSVTKDGYWVIMHDNTVDRMTNGTGAVKDLTLVQIQSFRIDNGSNISSLSDSDLVVPTVEQYFSICRSNGRGAFLEIKSADYTSQNYDDLATLIYKFGMDTSITLISFSLGALQEMKKRIPYLNVSFIVKKYSNDDAIKASQLGVNSGIDVGNYSTITADNVSYAHTKGLKVGVWTPPDDSNRDKFNSLAIDYVTTNSLSGNLRYSTLSTYDSDGGWEAGDFATEENHVEEIQPGKIFIMINVTSGKTKSNTRICKLPDWAVPMLHSIWCPAMARASNGAQAATVNIRGKNSGTGDAGYVVTGLSTTARWTYMSAVYSTFGFEL